jgi:DNA-binding NarL/FixJ family response regulator
MGYRILLADDCATVRLTVRTLLEHEGHDVVGEAEDGCDVIRQAAVLAPDIVILDLSMPCLNGIAAAGEIHRRSPHTRLILLSVHSGEEIIVAAMRAGILACVAKSDAADDLIRAVHEVARGATFLSVKPSRTLLEARLGH